MTETGIPFRKTTRAVAAAFSTFLLLVGCEEQPQQPRVTAAQQCDDTLSSDAAHALETVLATKRFNDAPTGGLARAEDQLIEDYATRERRSLHRPMCRAGVSHRTDRVEIRFGLYHPDDLFGDIRVSGLHPYVMGREARSGPEKAYLFVLCASPRLEGSARSPARIMGTLTLDNSKLPDTVAVREANLTVLHSVTLAVVKRLGCENNAGLTEKPVFRPR
ncbi:hypothetical protein [Streptomyces sp. NPDC127092]|uniref:hypothetical protein n=1 Tax=Streptomyces sp. NPDC127092 TaxID=3347135 RepID=UPI0036601465